MNELLIKLIKKWNSDKDRRRREHSAKLLDYFNGKQYKHLNGKPSWISDKQYNQRTQFFPNTLKEAITVLSYLYDEPPTREIPVNIDKENASENSIVSAESEAQKQSEFWNSKLWNFGDGLSRIMADMDPKIRLLGQVNVLATINSERNPKTLATFVGSDTESSDGFDLMSILPHQMTVLTEDGDPRFAKAVLIKVKELKDGKFVAHYYDSENFAIVTIKEKTLNDEGGADQIESHSGFESHNFGQLPIIELRNDRVEQSYWAEPIGGSDLIVNLDSLTRVWMQWLFATAVSTGQLVIQGAKDLTGDLGFDTAITTDDINAKIHTLNRDPKLSDRKDLINAMLDKIATSMNLPDGSLNVTSTAQSGVSLMMEQKDLVSDRKKREQIGSHWERSLHALCAGLWQSTEGFTPNPNVKVTYRPYTPILTESERQARITFQLDRGLIGKERALVMMNPGMTLSEARRWLQELQGPKVAIDGESVGGGPVDKVQDTALNGAQVTALQGMIAAVAANELPGEAAKVAILKAFPAFDESDVEKMINSASEFTQPAPTPQGGPDLFTPFEE